MKDLIREIRLLGQAAASADDDALARIVQLLDGLEQRGEADRVLDGVRPRLRRLRLGRPLRFTRLLFLPLGDAIQDPPMPDSDTPAVPRSALSALHACVRDALGAEAETIARDGAGMTTRDAAATARLGARLWPRAAEVLAAADTVPGLDHAALLLCTRLLGNGPAIWDAIAATDAPDGPDDAQLHAALAPLLAEEAEDLGPVGVVFRTLMARCDRPGRIVQAMAALHPKAKALALAHVDALLRATPPRFHKMESEVAAATAEDLAARFDDLRECSALPPDRRRLVGRQRAAIDEACRAGFAAIAKKQLLLPMARLARADVVEDAEVLQIEAGARRVRRLDLAGRRLGGAPAYERAVKEMVATISAFGGRNVRPNGLQNADLVRCIELLAGPDAAGAVHARLTGGRGR